MRGVFVGLLMLLSLAAIPAPKPSLSPIQPLYENGNVVCTIFSVNQQERLWITSYHCVKDQGKFGAGSKEAEITLVRWNEQYDLAMLQGGLPTPAMDLADSAPKAGLETFMEGYPLGKHQLLSFFGRVASPEYIFPDEDWKSAVYSMIGIDGMSGSPVQSRMGVVGIYSGVYQRRTGSIGWGATYRQLKDFVGPVWEGEN